MLQNRFASFALAASLAVAPMALAQAATTTSNTAGNESGAAVVPDSGANWHNNPLLTDNGSVRAGKLIGTDVYNNQDQKLGTVDGVLINRTGEAQVVLSANNKLVEVPWSRFEFGNAQSNSDHKVLLPTMTKNEVGNMQAFHYTPNGNHNG
jgi:opacity protein-like surface antigen